jgi:hypothetical protein
MADENEVQENEVKKYKAEDAVYNFTFVRWLITESKNVQELKDKIFTIPNFDVNRKYNISIKEKTISMPLIAVVCMFCKNNSTVAKLIDFLLSTYDIDINIQLSYGKSLLSRLIEVRYIGYAIVLMKHGADIDFIDTTGRNIIEMAHIDDKKYIEHYYFIYKNESVLKPAVNK